MIYMIWCEDIEHGIGIDNNLPWKIKDEMDHFRRTTMGKTILCGEKTFASWGNRLLPGRKNIVITLDKNYRPVPGCEVYYDLKDVIKDYKDKDIYVCGGRQIYNVFLPHADRLIISTLKKSYHCNVFMKFDLSNFIIDKTEHHELFDVNYYVRKK